MNNELLVFELFTAALLIQIYGTLATYQIYLGTFLKLSKSTMLAVCKLFSYSV